MNAERLGESSRPIWTHKVHAHPSYPRSGEPGVVHLGLGAFHRAHQAMVFDRLLATGDTRWGVHGVGMTQPALVDALRAQDGLYAVRIADAQGERWEVPGALWRFDVAATARGAVVQAIGHRATRWITLTVTEKGYTPVLAKLLLDGLVLRQREGLPGLTIASCDNLQSNGQQLKALLLSHTTDRDLTGWLENHCAFPCSMVDRIVPASSESLREAARSQLGVSDATALGVEVFWEWVIEDCFADPSDGALLAAQGVRVTRDVHAYEQAKLRMLNGSHTAMALMGAITGRAHIADCIGHPPVRHYIRRLMEHEVAPHLARQDWPAYRDALIGRFGNPYLRHSVHQIAMDSSLKIPQRWPVSIRAQLACGAGIDHHALAAAAWLRYGLGEDERGRPYEISDPDADRLRSIAALQRTDGDHCVQTMLAVPQWWGTDLVHHERWVERVKYWHRHVLAQGMDWAVEQLLGEVA
ncbi:mannitol dehydrogenase family protein [Limnohabitans sp.]|uniref:mannitol dehydrogenase family protein n=1 Tax=Limnohabitans sp. TaxID=1907725 RepID=UPI00391CCB2E